MRSRQSLNYSRYFQLYTVPEGSLPRSQEPAISFYPEPMNPVYITLYYLSKIRLKVKLSLYLTKQGQCQEDIRRNGDVAPPFLTSALDGGQWLVSRPGRFTPGERASCTQWIGDWAGPLACLIVREKQQIFPLPGFEPRLSSQ
jgi:hypothetical protein